MVRGGRRITLAIAVLIAGLHSLPAIGQNLGTPRSQVLVLDSERAYSASAAGQQITKDLEARLAGLVSENRRIEAELATEELKLTDERVSMEPVAFRKLADAFDQKVQQIRTEQDAKQQELQRLRDAEQQSFIEAMTPIISAIASEYGALVILERRNVLLSAGSIDITDAVIARINAGLEVTPATPSQSPGERPGVSLGESLGELPSEAGDATLQGTGTND